jgi:hypothetical protein
MSAQFDSINWKRLKHAYGPATNVPGLLRLLSNPTEAVRQEAVMELCDCINDQCCIYEATVAIVPCLFELVVDPFAPDRARVLELLGGISESWTEAHCDPASDPLTWRIRWQSVADPGSWEQLYREAHQAVEDRITILTDLLRDPDVEVRIATAFVLETFLDRSEEAVAVLVKTVDDETHDLCRAAAIFAQGGPGCLQPGSTRGIQVKLAPPEMFNINPANRYSDCSSLQIPAYRAK